VVALHNEVGQQLFAGHFGAVLGGFMVVGFNFHGYEFAHAHILNVVQPNGRHAMGYGFALWVQQAFVGQYFNFGKEFHRAKLGRKGRLEKVIQAQFVFI
jgi:hypothetical protein